jgi:hypothetical protein
MKCSAAIPSHQRERFFQNALPPSIQQYLAQFGHDADDVAELLDFWSVVVVEEA